MATTLTTNRKPKLDEAMWFVPHRRLASERAITEAKDIAAWIGSSRDERHEPSETDLFIAMHTCAYQATGGSGMKRVTPATRCAWVDRWRIIREYIVEANIGLVYSTLGRFRKLNVDDDQLTSDAFYALAKAVRRFNPWRGYRFSTYACNAIYRICARRCKRDIDHRQRFSVQLDTTYERPVREAKSETPFRIERLRRLLDRNSGGLSELEQRILSKRFPLDDEGRLTFREIGRCVGLSKERVRQIQNEALTKLRDVLLTDPVLQ